MSAPDPDRGHRVRLRADLVTPPLPVVPGEEVFAELRLLNTSEVIERVSVQLVGLMAESVAISPSELTLFPGESAEVRLELRFDRALPAGQHEGLVVVTGASGRLAPAMVTLQIEVPSAAAMAIEAEPPVKTAGRKAAFEVYVANKGNTPLTVQVRALDANRALSLLLTKPTFTIPVEQSETIGLIARGKRPWTGSPIDHLISIEVAAGELEDTADLHFRQKPRLTAGVITLLTLVLIIGLWAAAMYFGVGRALAPPDPTKLLPASFDAGVGIEDLDPTEVGGTFSGAVTASTTNQPLARVTVEAFDLKGRLVSATATGDDGAFELTGLLPVRHRLRIRAPGFQELWWPAAASASGAEALLASPNEPTVGVNAQLVGEPGALGGQAIAGDGEAVTVGVVLEALDLVDGGEPRTVQADADGVWSVSGLAAPATYRITYRAEGYTPVEIVQPLDAAQQLVVNTTRLPAAQGVLRGTTVDRDGTAIGGVEILAQRGADEFAFTTPTTGTVGIFVFEDLETPGTYLLTFVADGYAQETRAVRLGPGEVREDLVVALSPATGTVTGVVTATADGAPLGGVQVTVSGGGVVLQTDTLTAGQVGTFRLSGLPLPGTYTVTFDLDGHARETVRVQLSPEAPQVVADTAMGESVGGFLGRVLDDASGEPLAAVEIEVSDGATVHTTTTASLPASERGTFRIGDLPPGSYTLTARRANGASMTVLGEIRAGEVTTVEIRMGAAS